MYVIFYTFNKELIMMAITLYHMISLLLAKVILILSIIIMMKIIVIISFYNYIHLLLML